MSSTTETFAVLDCAKGIAPLPEKQDEEMPLPAWYRSVYHISLDQLTIEDLSKAARQQIHSERIVPLVIERLQSEPLAGEMFDGELLVSLRSIGADYWSSHLKDAANVRTVIVAAWNDLPEDIQTDAKEILHVLGY